MKLVRCSRCEADVPRSRARQKVEMFSRTYGRGSLTDVALQRRIDEWLCDSCVLALEHEAAGGQEAMFS